MTEMHDETASAETSVARDGRVTIPFQVRRLLKIETGAQLVVYAENGRVVMEDRAHMLARLQDEAIAAAATAGHTGLASEELIAERRAEATREDPSPTAADAGSPV